MNRVLEELGRLRAAPDPDTVHDLRVAIPHGQKCAESPAGYFEVSELFATRK
jgi:CHAD domain-containing protein